MHFTVTATGTVRADVDAENLGIDADRINPWDSDGDVDISDVSLKGTVEVEAFVTVRNIEVEVVDYEDFDAEQAVGEAVDPYGSPNVSGAEFEVTDSPAGFSDVESEHGFDEALGFYKTLARNGWDVI